MSATAGSLTGFGVLTRFVIRRDRIRSAVWIASIVIVVVATISSIKGLYPTQADLDKAALASQNNAAAIIFNGPPQGLDTVGGQVAFQTGSFGLVLMGLMSIFMLGRLTRGEEEAGRSELLGSLPVGEHAPAASALTVVGAMNVITGTLVAAACIGFGLPVTGSVVFGLSFILLGLLFAAITLVFAQVSENTRVVYGLGGFVLGAAFVLRAIGDIGNGAVSWLSPIGWAQKTRPFAGEQWWPFLIIVTTTGLLAWLAASLSRRRDLGAGLIAPRPGPARGAPALGSPLGLATRIQRGSVIGWTAGLAVLAVAYGSITDSINEFVKDNKSLSDIVAAQGHGTLVEQYVAMSFRILALVAAGFAVQAALRMRSEETAGRAEPVLATPVSRVRFASGHLAMAFGGTFAIMALLGLTFGVSDAAVTGDAGAIGQSIVTALLFVPAVWLLVGLAMALVGLFPRATAATWGVLGVCFVIGMFGQVLGLSAWVQDASPFQHVPTYPAGTIEILPLVALLAIAASLTALGLYGLRQRDIG